MTSLKKGTEDYEGPTGLEWHLQGLLSDIPVTTNTVWLCNVCKYPNKDNQKSCKACFRDRHPVWIRMHDSSSTNAEDISLCIGDIISFSDHTGELEIEYVPDAHNEWKKERQQALENFRIYKIIVIQSIQRGRAARKNFAIMRKKHREKIKLEQTKLVKSALSSAAMVAKGAAVFASVNLKRISHILIDVSDFEDIFAWADDQLDKVSIDNISVKDDQLDKVSVDNILVKETIDDATTVDESFTADKVNLNVKENSNIKVESSKVVFDSKEDMSYVGDKAKPDNDTGVLEQKVKNGISKSNGKMKAQSNEQFQTNDCAPKFENESDERKFQSSYNHLSDAFIHHRKRVIAAINNYKSLMSRPTETSRKYHRWLDHNVVGVVTDILHCPYKVVKVYTVPGKPPLPPPPRPPTPPPPKVDNSKLEKEISTAAAKAASASVICAVDAMKFSSVAHFAACVARHQVAIDKRAALVKELKTLKTNAQKKRKKVAIKEARDEEALCLSLREKAALVVAEYAGTPDTPPSENQSGGHVENLSSMETASTKSSINPQKQKIENALREAETNERQKNEEIRKKRAQKHAEARKKARKDRLEKNKRKIEQKKERDRQIEESIATQKVGNGRSKLANKKNKMAAELRKKRKMQILGIQSVIDTQSKSLPMLQSTTDIDHNANKLELSSAAFNKEDPKEVNKYKDKDQKHTLLPPSLTNEGIAEIPMHQGLRPLTENEKTLQNLQNAEKLNDQVSKTLLKHIENSEGTKGGIESPIISFKNSNETSQDVYIQKHGKVKTPEEKVLKSDTNNILGPLSNFNKQKMDEISKSLEAHKLSQMIDVKIAMRVNESNREINEENKDTKDMKESKHMDKEETCDTHSIPQLNNELYYWGDGSPTEINGGWCEDDRDKPLYRKFRFNQCFKASKPNSTFSSISDIPGFQKIAEDDIRAISLRNDLQRWARCGSPYCRLIFSVHNSFCIGLTDEELKTRSDRLRNCVKLLWSELKKAREHKAMLLERGLIGDRTVAATNKIKSILERIKSHKHEMIQPSMWCPYCGWRAGADVMEDL